jgi:hypothetical protein
VPEIRKDISGIFASGMQTARAEEITIRGSLLKLRGSRGAAGRTSSAQFAMDTRLASPISERTPLFMFSVRRAQRRHDLVPFGSQPTRVEGMSNDRRMAAPLTMARFIGLTPTLPEKIGTVVRPVTMRYHVRHRPLCDGEYSGNKYYWRGWGAVMVAKCSNPSCSASFRSLKEGRLWPCPLNPYPMTECIP